MEAVFRARKRGLTVLCRNFSQSARRSNCKILPYGQWFVPFQTEEAKFISTPFSLRLLNFPTFN